MDPTTRLIPPQGARPRAASDLPLVQAALRRRRAERAFEDYVREMARRWRLETGSEEPGAGGEALPRA